MVLVELNKPSSLDCVRDLVGHFSHYTMMGLFGQGDRVTTGVYPRLPCPLDTLGSGVGGGVGWWGWGSVFGIGHTLVTQGA